MAWYKTYLQNLRRKELRDPYLLLNGDITVKLREYILLLEAAKFEDGIYHSYYGEIKMIIGSFNTYWNETIYDIIVAADKYTNVVTKDELMNLMEKTINMHQIKQVDFGRQYLPVRSQSERQIYEEIEEMYNGFMEELYKMQASLDKLDKKEKIIDFAKEHFPMCVRRETEIFTFTQDYMSFALADKLNEIRTSIEELLLSALNNLKELEDECDASIKKLLQQLYEKNKEQLTDSRREVRNSKEAAEIKRGLELIREKIETKNKNMPIAKLTVEMSHWKLKLQEINHIGDTLKKLKEEEAEVSKQIEIYESMTTTELPGSKKTCFNNMGENYKIRQKYLKEKSEEIIRTLVTFFTVKGFDRILYADNIGPYYLDEYGHQVYVFDSGLKHYHVNCEGDFKMMHFKDLKHFDENGRYIIQNGEKVYQCAPCTSTYKLREDTLFEKTTKDCGHSEQRNENCRMAVKDPNDVELLPMTDPVDIKSTLDADTVKYLWDCFGGVLPDALYDVDQAKPKNPIFYLAHRLLMHKYKRMPLELRKKMKDAEQYRENIFQDRKEKAISLAKEWRSKQVKRRKPEESDNTEDRAVYDAHIASLMFINSLDYYNT